MGAAHAEEGADADGLGVAKGVELAVGLSGVVLAVECADAVKELTAPRFRKVGERVPNPEPIGVRVGDVDVITFELLHKYFYLLDKVIVRLNAIPIYSSLRCKHLCSEVNARIWDGILIDVGGIVVGSEADTHHIGTLPVDGDAEGRVFTEQCRELFLVVLRICNRDEGEVPRAGTGLHHQCHLRAVAKGAKDDLHVGKRLVVLQVDVDADESRVCREVSRAA